MYQRFTRAFCLLAVGVLAIMAACVVKKVHPYDLIFKWKLVMERNGEIFNLWEKPPVDLYIKIYLFNITNAEAFLAGREKMNVKQVGPYVYKEIMTHENVTFNANNTMSTIPKHPLVWQEHLSEGHKEDDEVIMLNIAMLAISQIIADKPYFVRMALTALLASTQSEPIVRMTAKEFMFGYPTSLTKIGNTFLPNWIHFEKVGLIDRMYDFDTDYETFHTGVSDPSVSGLYATYRGSRNLPQWNEEHCSNIEFASDGTKFKSFIQPNDTVKFFRKSMCRPINLYRVDDAKTYGSLSGYSYVFEDNAFDNGAVNGKNKCFCRNGHCQPAGLIDVTDCYYGFPISLSYPHFMDGEFGLQNNITGLVPDRKSHASSFVVQPESGLPLSISAKIQINMHFKDLRSIRKVSRFSHLTVPMLWFDIMMPKLSDSLDSRFNFYLNILPYLDTLGFWGPLIIGIGLVIYAVTRATLQQYNAVPLKYCKANLLHATSGHGAGVYNPCEMKLITTNEKQSLPQHQQQQQQLPEKHHQLSDEESDDAAIDILYTEVDPKKRQSAFALELEPAISGSESSDEGNDSDSATATLSRNSTSSSCMDDQHDEKNAKNISNSYGSSGLASSLTDSNDDTLLSCTKSGTTLRGNNEYSRWSNDSNTILSASSSMSISPLTPSMAAAKNHQMFDV